MKKVRIEFIGWQRCLDNRHFPLFNVFGHKIIANGSSVNDLALETHGLKMPKIPSYEGWLRMVGKNKRRGR